jgi:hypothetical protein
MQRSRAEDPMTTRIPTRALALVAFVPLTACSIDLDFDSE